MAILPTRFLSPSRSILNFADDRAREADSIGSVITKLAAPLVNQPQPLGTAPVQRMAATPADYVPPTANQPSTTTFGTNDLVNRLPQNVNTDPDYWLNVKPFERPPSALDPQSLEKLAIGDHRLQTLMAETARRAKEQGIDFKVSETARDPQRQAELVAAGKSQTMNSKHLTGNAADIYVVGPDGQPNWDFAAYQPVADIAKEVAAELGYDDFVWGGDWNTLKDGVHFQLGGVSGGDGANSMIGGAGADTLGGGGMNVESILASLYPQMSPEEEKRQRRKDIFLALSQGLGAISQGRPVDVSNVVARSDERKRQAVLDMRERERARAAASLVYSQTGDRDLAAGIASGAISYGDVVSERERRRVQNEADANRLKQEQANGRLAGIVDSMWGDLGLPDSVRDEVIAGINAGDDPNTIFTLNEQAKVAEAARKAEEEAAAMADQRAAAIDSLAASTDPVDQMTARVLALDPNISLKDAEAIARERLKPTTEEFAPSEPQKIWSESLAALPTEEERKAFRELYPTPAALEMALRQKDGGPTFFVGTDANGMSTVTGVTGGPQGATTAAPAPAVAPQGIAGAFTSQFGPMTTGVPAVGAAPAAPTAVAPATTTAPTTAAPTAVAPATTTAPTTAAPSLPLPVQERLTALNKIAQDLRQAIATAPDEQAKLAAEADLKRVEADLAALTAPFEAEEARLTAENLQKTVDQAALDYDTAVATQSTDIEMKKVALDAAKANLQEAQLRIKALETSAEQAEAEAASAAEKAAMRDLQRIQGMDTVFREGFKVLDRTKDWQSGVIPQSLAAAGSVVWGTDAHFVDNRLSGIRNSIALDTLIQIKEASPTGGALGSVSNQESERLEQKTGKLSVSDDPTALRDNTGAAMNLYADTVHGTPEQIRKLYEEGKITAAEADIYSTRLLPASKASSATIMTEHGPATNLGLSDVTVTQTIYGRAEPVGGAEPSVSAASPDPEFEARILADPTIIENMTLDDYNALSAEQKRVFDRLAGEE